LSITPASGMTPATLTVTADPTRLSPGTYLGQITVSADGIGKVVNVLLSVGAPGTSGAFTVSPTSLTFIGQTGLGILPHQMISVINSNPNSPSRTFRTVVTSSGWLVADPQQLATPANVPITAIQAGIAAGTYTGTVTFVPLDGGAPTVVPVTLSATGDAGTADRLKLSQTAITVNHQIGTTEPPVQFVGVTSTRGYINYTASTTTTWLKLTSTFNAEPSSSVTDSAPGAFTVNIDPTGLPLGTHIGSVQVTSDGHAAVQLPVQLTITTAPALNAQPSSLEFDETIGNEDSITVTSTGTSTLSFTASVPPGSEWVSVSPHTGSTAAGGQILTVRINTQGLPAGTHTARIFLTAQNGTVLTIPVRATVSTAATIGPLLFSPESVTLSAVSGGSNPSQVIEIRPESGGTQNYTASASSTGGWLQVQPFSGTAPGRITVAADLAAAPGFGSHNGAVTVTSLATAQQFTIPVRLDYTGEGIVATPSSVTFVQPREGVAPPAQVVQITSAIPSTWRVTDKPNWVTVTPMQGSTPDTATFFAEVALIPPGSNTGTVRIAGPRNTLNVPITIRVSETPPTAPEPIALTYALGSSEPPVRTIPVESGGRSATFTVAVTTESGVPWLLATPASGATPGTVRVTIDPTKVTTGRQNGAVRITTTINSATQVDSYPVVLTVTLPPATIQSVLHSATVNPTPVSPGMLITITGVGLGPAAGVSAKPSGAGAYETKLGDTRVLFDGTAAPILYARHDQINAIVPYSVYGRVATRINVDIAGSWSLPIDSKVVDAAPGLFTVTGTSRGQASAVNADFTTNSPSNPAQRGTVITVYGTGEGQTDPAGQDGRVIATDLRRPLLPVTATIGGRNAEVTYAGSAPMQVSGMLQINIRVPEDIEPGAVPLEVRIGGVPSQTGVTIVVR
jgi:uncharacterized protein (TIGR03437 family)